MESLLRDLRYAVRGLRREPGFSLAAVLTLALGSGAAVGIFAIVNAVLLRPLPYRDPERVVLVWAARPDGARTWLSPPELDDLSRDARSFSAIAGMTDLRMNLVASGEPEEIQVVAASATLFPLLGVDAAHGALFDAADDVEGAARVVVLSDALWRVRFGADPRVIGRLLQLDGQAYVVKGVLPPGFSVLPPSSVFPSRVDAWVALRPHAAARGRDVRYLHAVARLAPAVSIDRARDELAALGAGDSAAFPQAYGGQRWSFHPVDFHADVVRLARPVLLALGGIVAVVLVVACVNVANLLLARGERRRRELIVRVALGAGPGRLARLLCSEALVLTVAGCGAGSLLALAVPRAIAALDPAALPRLDAAVVDVRLLAFVVLLLVVVTAFFALVPAFAALRARDAATVDRSIGRSVRAVGIGRLLAVAQVALAALALVATAMLTQTALRLQRVPSGLDPDDVLTFRVTLPSSYRAGTQIAGFFARAADRLHALPGVIDVGAVTQLPMSGASLGSTFASWDEAVPRAIDADLRGITPGYFSTLRIPLVAGRGFTAADAQGHPSVAIVDRAFARRLRPDGNVIGLRLRWIRSPADPIQIVGVAGDVRHRGPAEPVHETVYRPAAQYPRSSMTFVLRAPNAAALAAAVTGAVHEIDPSQPVADVRPLSAVVSGTMARPRLGAMLGLSLGVLALIVAVIGVYGVINHGVGQRVREFAVRLALGARPGSILVLVMREGLGVTVAGLAAGLALGPVAARGLGSAMYGMDAAGWPAYAASGAVLAAAAAVACYLPARRASRSDPMAALRSE